MILFIFLTLTAFFVSGIFIDDTNKVTMMKGDSVTLHTGVKTIHLEDIKWYCNNTRIAQMNGDLNFICTDVQCNNGTERFRDRLKLDQTGSLSIRDIRNTDSGLYELKIIGSNSIIEKIFSFTVLDVSAAERDEMKKKSVKEGESVTLDPGVMRTPNVVMTWYFNDTLIAEITGDQSNICTDEQCDRLKLDHQTGSLTITNTRTTDSGLYQLQISSSSSITSWKTFTVTVFGFALSSAAVAVICVCVLLLVAAVTGGIYYGRRQAKRNDSRRRFSDQESNLKDSSPMRLLDTANEMSPDGNETKAAIIRH